MSDLSEHDLTLLVGWYFETADPERSLETCVAAIVARHRAEAAREAVGLLNDLVTAKKLQLDAEEWQLVWDRVFRFLDRAAQTDSTAGADKKKLEKEEED